jgi:hypothetical protein
MRRTFRPLAALAMVAYKTAVSRGRGNVGAP